MLTPPAGLAIYVATRPVDFRKGADGLGQNSDIRNFTILATKQGQIGATTF